MPPNFFTKIQGTGDPLVLLHGFPLDHRIWNGISDELSQHNRVIMPDLPGFGKSLPPKAFTMESLADAVHELLHELKALPCVLGGLSMGGYTALAYAKKYPQTLKGLLLIDTRAEADTPQGKENRNAMIVLAKEKGSAAIADQMLPKMLGPSPDPSVASELKQIMNACPSETIQYALAALRDRADQTSLLPKISVPTLIIVGDGDAITPPAMARQMHEGIAGSKLVVVKNAGHLSPMEQPAIVAAAIAEFCSTGGPPVSYK